MNVDTNQFRRAHAELSDRASQLAAAAQAFPSLAVTEREALRGHVLAYLQEEVEPHTRLDELVLYPSVAARLGDPLVTASMNYDHLAIREWIERLERADITDTADCQQLLYGLEALIRVHVWKENELFLASLESASWPPAAR